MDPIPGDPWATRELWVKWKGYSYIHCTWDTCATLIQLAGWKRAQNYIRRCDDQEVG